MLNFPVVRELALFKSSAIFTEEKEKTEIHRPTQERPHYTLNGEKKLNLTIKNPIHWLPLSTSPPGRFSFTSLIGRWLIFWCRLAPVDEGHRNTFTVVVHSTGSCGSIAQIATQKIIFPKTNSACADERSTTMMMATRNMKRNPLSSLLFHRSSERESLYERKEQKIKIRGAKRNFRKNILLRLCVLVAFYVCQEYGQKEERFHVQDKNFFSSRARDALARWWPKMAFDGPQLSFFFASKKEKFILQCSRERLSAISHRVQSQRETFVLPSN